MEEVVVAEVDILVMVVRRNNGPVPVAQMAAVTKNKNKICYQVIEK